MVKEFPVYRAIVSCALRRAAHIAALLAAFVLCGASISRADPTIAQLCSTAAASASRATGVPLDVLTAISLTETGRKFGGKLQPWPWTVNMEGAGKWFQSRTLAQEFVDKNFARGARSFDVGCFQINYRWHGQAFRTLEDMFDPVTNATYAAQFLSELYGELGDWGKAAGAYHSRTPKFASRYRARFERIRRGVRDNPDPVLDVARMEIPATADPSATRKNHFPLLQNNGGRRTRGSLVQLSDTPGIGRLIRIADGAPIGVVE